MYDVSLMATFILWKPHSTLMLFAAFVFQKVTTIKHNKREPLDDNTLFKNLSGSREDIFMF